MLSLQMYWVVRDFAATYTEQGTFPSLFYAHLISRWNSGILNGERNVATLL
jgi:hypothetical protein